MSSGLIVSRKDIPSITIFVYFMGLSRDLDSTWHCHFSPLELIASVLMISPPLLLGEAPFAAPETSRTSYTSEIASRIPEADRRLPEETITQDVDDKAGILEFLAALDINSGKEPEAEAMAEKEEHSGKTSSASSGSGGSGGSLSWGTQAVLLNRH